MPQVGRPSKYDSAYCEAIIAFCEDGSSLSSFAASIGVARSTLNEWAEHHPEFSEAVKAAKTRVAAWYDRIGRKVAENGGGNATLCIFGLKNFDADDFRDVQEQKHSGEVTVNKIVREFVGPSHQDG
jgi:hypothetical protein